MNHNLVKKVLILTKSMITKNNFRNPLSQLNEFEKKFNEENLTLGKITKDYIQN